MIIGLFAAFILLCGLTHGFNAVRVRLTVNFLGGHPELSAAEDVVRGDGAVLPAPPKQGFNFFSLAWQDQCHIFCWKGLFDMSTCN